MPDLPSLDPIFTADKRLYARLDLKGRARAMRHQPTPAEDALWQALRGDQLPAKFRRQHVIDRYIVDFVSFPAKLIVEADGGTHLAPEQADYDQGRSDLLAELGYRVLRFPNEQILNDLAGVLAVIRAALAELRG